MEGTGTKNILIATVLIFLFLVIWQLFIFKPKVQQTPEKKPVEEKAVPTVTTERPLIEGLDSTIFVETPLYIAKISKKGGAIVSFQLKKYKTGKGNPVNLVKKGGALLYSPDKFFEFAGSDTIKVDQIVELVLTDTVDSTIKRYVFDPSSMLIGLTVESKKPSPLISAGGLNFTEKSRKEEERYYSFLLKNDKLKKISIKKLKEIKKYPLDNLRWFGVRTKYFLFATIPTTKEGVVEFQSKPETITFSAPALKKEFKVYVGPIDYFILKKIGYDLSSVYEFGFFLIRPFSMGILYLLRFLHSFIPNYGWILVIFALIMKIVFFPLSRKSISSMKRMQELKPKMDALQKIYKNDPQKLQKEMMELYKKYKVNPFSGCLTLLVQLPIFWALYQILRTTIDLRGAPFIFWIKDLSAKDPYYILPILMGLTSILLSRVQGTAKDPQSKMFAYFMPIFLTLIFLSFPSGIVLYWLTFNVLGVLEMLLIKRLEVRYD